jgi:hypothetical protein
MLRRLWRWRWRWVRCFVPLALVWSCSPAPEQAGAEAELEPIESSLTDPSPYHTFLRSVLLDKVPHRAELQCLALPSFQPETLVSVHQNEGGFTAVLVKPQAPIWAAAEEKEARKDIPCTQAKKELPKDLALRLRQAWREMCARSRFGGCPPCGVDGIGYMFLASSDGAEAFNPESGTRPFQLAEIGMQLIAYVEARPEQEQELAAAIAAALTTLERELAKKAPVAAVKGGQRGR